MHIIAAHWPEIVLTAVIAACAAVFVWACQSCTGSDDDR
jgi:hypothetical protein